MVLRGFAWFFHKELPSMLRVFYGCFCPLVFRPVFKLKSALAPQRGRDGQEAPFSELAPQDSSIIPSQAQEPSREFSWLSQWRRTDGRLFPSDNRLLSFRDLQARKTSGQGQEFTPTILFPRFRTRPRLGPSEKHQQPKA